MSEKLKIFIIGLVYMVINFTINFATILSYSIFLKKLGPQYMAYHYMSFILSSFAGIILYRINLPGIKGLNLVSIIMGMIYLFFPLYVAIHEGAVTFTIYILTRLYFIYITIFFFDFLNNTLTVREIKKYIGIISATGFIGSILAGFLTKPLLAKHSMDFCFIITGIICILTIFPLFLLKGKNFKEEIKVEKGKISFSAIINMSFIKVMIAFVILSGFIRYFIDFQFSDFLSSHFNNNKELAVFYGNFTALSNFSVFMSQILFTGRLLKNLSLSTIFKVISLIFMFFSALSVITPFFWVIVSFQFIFTLILRIMIEPSRKILTGAVSSEMRVEVRFLIEGIFYALGVCLTGITIAVLNLLSPPAVTFFMIIFILSFLYYICGGKLNSTYVEALLGNLRKKEQTDVTELESKMENLKELALMDSEEAKMKILEELNKEKEPSILNNIIKITGNLKKDEKLYKKIIENLTGDNIIKLTSIEVLAKWGDEESLKTIYPFIFEKEIRVKSTAILAVIKLSSNPEELRNALMELISILRDEDREKRITGLSIIGELGISCFIPTVSEFFNDKDINVREWAINVASKLKAPSLMEDLLMMLKNEENKEIYGLIYEGIESIRHNNFEKLLFLTGGLNSEDKKNVITNLKKIENYHYQDISLKALSLEDRSLAVKIIELLERYKDDSTYIQLLKDCFIEKDFSPLLLIINTIRNKNINTPPARLLKEIANENTNHIISERLIEIINESKDYNREFIKICFYITGICSIGIDNAMKAFDYILSGETRKKDIAIEIIDTGINDKNLKNSILNLVSQCS